jgi:HEAT repeat protein
LLDSHDPEARKRGAWCAARGEAPQALNVIVDSLTNNREPDAGVRESYIYALGQVGTAQHFGIAVRLVESDAGPFVRQAAWLAAARLDIGRFQQVGDRLRLVDEGWDPVGRAAAWLELGDTRGVVDLLRAAEDGTDAERRFASLSLFRGLAPLLEAVGRWPLDARVGEGDPWPPELVAEVRRRCADLDLQALASAAGQHLARATPVRREIGRLNSTRARLIHLLGIP